MSEPIGFNTANNTHATKDTAALERVTAISDGVRAKLVDTHRKTVGSRYVPRSIEAVGNTEERRQPLLRETFMGMMIEASSRALKARGGEGYGRIIPASKEDASEKKTGFFWVFPIEYNGKERERVVAVSVVSDHEFRNMPHRNHAYPPFSEFQQRYNLKKEGWGVATIDRLVVGMDTQLYHAMYRSLVASIIDSDKHTGPEQLYLASANKAITELKRQSIKGDKPVSLIQIRHDTALGPLRDATLDHGANLLVDIFRAHDDLN